MKGLARSSDIWTSAPKIGPLRHNVPIKQAYVANTE